MNDGLLGFPAALRQYEPKWTAPTTNPVIGNGTLLGFWGEAFGMVAVSISMVPGSTTTFGSGIWAFSLPRPARRGFRQALRASALDVGTQHYDGSASLLGGWTTDEIVIGSNAAGPTNPHATNPFTWSAANGDWLTISGLYVPA